MSDYFGNISISGKSQDKSKEKTTPKVKPEAPPPQKPVEAKPAKKQPVTPKPPKKPKREKQEIRWGRFFLFSFLVIGIILALYAAAGFFLAPDLLKTSIADRINNTAGLKTSIGKASFNPFSFRVRFQDVTLDTQDTRSTNRQQPLLKIDNFDVNLEITSILRSRLVCSHLNIDGFKLAITRDKQKKYNFASLNRDPGKKVDSDMIEFSKLPFLFSLNNVVARRGEIIFDDRFSSKVHKAEQVELQLPTLANFTTITTTTVQPRFSAIINGSPIKLLGDTDPSAAGDPADSRTRLSCDISSLDLPLYFDYLPASMPLTLTKGTAEGALQLSFALNKEDGKRLTVDFDINSYDIDIQSTDKALVMKAPRVSLKGSVQPFTGGLYLKEFLVHEPQITTRDHFGPNSLMKLIPLFGQGKNAGPGQRKKRDLIIDKLLFDGGTVQVNSKRGSTTWNSVLFNLNRYNRNGQAAKNTSSSGNFSLSGNQSGNDTSFSWKGSLDQTNQMVGDVRVQSLSPSVFFSFLGADSQAASGSCDIRGRLTLKQEKRKAPTLAYSLDDSTIIIDRLRLKQNDHQWLHAPKVKLVSFSSSQNKINLGNLFVEKGNLSIHSKKLPPLLLAFSANKHFSLHGLDYSGNLTIHPDTNGQPIKLTDLNFQANNLDNTKIADSNFGLTSLVGKKGELKAQGTFSLKPLKGSVELSFSKLPPDILVEHYMEKPVGFGQQATINGQGTLTFPSWTYTGSLGVNRVHFKQKESAREVSWSKGIVDNFVVSRKPFQMELSNISATNLKITEKGLPWFAAGSFSVDKAAKEKNDIVLGQTQIKKGKITLIEDRFPKILDSWFTKRETATRIQSINYSGSLTIQPQKKKTKTLKLTNIRLKADNLDDNSKVSDNLSFSATVNSSGTFKSKGDLALTPLRTSVFCNFSSIRSSHIFPWITDAKILQESQAVFSGKGRLTYPKNSYSGFLQAADTRIRKNRDELLLGWRTASFHKLNVELDPLQISSTKAVINEPGFGWSRVQNGPNVHQQASSFLHTLLAKPDKNTAGSGGRKQPINLKIGKIILKNGSAQHIDERLRPVWQTEITGINGSLKTIDTTNPDVETAFNITASLAGSPVTVLGSTKLMSKKTNGNVLLKMTTVPVSLFTDQIKSSVEIDPSAGAFDLVMTSKYQDDVKSGSAHFTFTSLASTTSESDTAVPIALMSNSNQTQMYVPLENSSSRSSRPLLNKTINLFQTKVIKAKYSPILLAGEQFSDLVNNHSVECVIGKKSITENGRSLMARYTSLVKNHPKLRLTIIGSADPVKDNPPLKEKLMAQELIRVKEENARRATKRKKREEILKTQLAQQKKKKQGFTETNLDISQQANLDPIQPQPVTVSEKMLRELAISRAHEVYNQFVAINNLAPEQLLLSEEVRVGKDPVSGGNRVIIQLSARP